MKSLFRWSLNHSVLGFLLFILIQAAIFAVGFPVILRGYDQRQIKEKIEIARSILLNIDSLDMIPIDNSRPFFVFSADKELLFSNRGKGRSIPEGDLVPVPYDNAVIGYFYGENLHFTGDRNNLIFLSSSLLLLGFSIVISGVIGVLMSFRSSRVIVNSIEVIRNDIAGLKDESPLEERSFPVTELSDISRSLAEIHQLLISQEEYKRQWMQDISHDLRTPISGLRGQLEGMADGILPPTTERFKHTLQEIDRLEHLTESVSRLFRLESLPSLRMEDVRIDSVLTHLVSSLSLAMEEKELTVEYEPEPITVQGQHDLLERGIGNILENSVNYTPRGGRITLRAVETGGILELRIGNTSEPVPEEQVDKIFQRFYRGESGRTTRGTGLGLNIVREICKLHHGTVEISKNDSSGVEFLIRLPIILQEENNT